MSPPDTGKRVLVATIALIVILAWAIGGHGIWTGERFPVSR